MGQHNHIRHLVLKGRFQRKEHLSEKAGGRQVCLGRWAFHLGIYPSRGEKRNCRLENKWKKCKSTALFKIMTRTEKELIGTCLRRIMVHSSLFTLVYTVSDWDIGFHLFCVWSQLRDQGGIWSLHRGLKAGVKGGVFISFGFMCWKGFISNELMDIKSDDIYDSMIMMKLFWWI